MRHRRAWYALLAGGVLLAALSVPITLIALSGRLPLYTYALSSALSSLGATPIHEYGADGGPITAVLISPDDVTLQIVMIQKDGTTWFFQIQAHNRNSNAVALLDGATNHYFALGLQGTPGTPSTWQQSTIRLRAPRGTELATYPALDPVLASGAESTGWLVADLSQSPYPPVQLFYVYGTVTALGCKNPQDPSSCQPSTGYRTLVWVFQPQTGD